MLSSRHKACCLCKSRLRQPRCRQLSSSTGGEVRSSRQIRQHFIDFFSNSNAHKFVKSSSVIPRKGDGVYFTNAGMNQFKPIFLGAIPEGSDLATYKRVVNSQKCIRVGGKHNDLDDVGHDLTHHTFFEMLGSWSFGDYFKKEACSMAFELLVNVYKLPLDRLYFTYFGGNARLGLEPDLECRDVWRQLGIPDSRLLPFGMKDNFWDMGETGPCGPCTEIHYDHVSNRDASHLVNMDSPEVVEIWNLVFMQYNRLGPDRLVGLPRNHVDTGMGLERLCAVLQGTRSNYNTDLFLPIFHTIHKETCSPPYTDSGTATDVAYRILADHSRMAAVCISDGLLPGTHFTEHRLRSVIYRALYQGHHVMNAKPGLLGKLVPPIVQSLGDAFPEISANAEKVTLVLNQTEEHYLQKYEEAQKCFNKLKPGTKTLYGDAVQRLYSGFFGHRVSLELIEMIARQRGLAIQEGVIEEWHQHSTRQGSIVASKEYPCLTTELIDAIQNERIPVTDDSLKYEYSVHKHGHYDFPSVTSKVVGMVDDSNAMSRKVHTGTRVAVLVAQTPFYAEKGGQAGDRGTITSETGSVQVEDTQSSNGYVLHIGTVVDGHIATGQPATLVLDKVYRTGCMRNHTATHLVNSALRRVLGADVCQRGSSVTPDKLTFDFSSLKTVTNEEIIEMERLVQAWIASNLPVQRLLVPAKEALSQKDIIRLENVTYPGQVYVISMQDELDGNGCSSKELCGGTHVLSTGDLRPFCITSLTGHDTSTKSIVCLTAEAAEQAEENVSKATSLYNQLRSLLKTKPVDLESCINVRKQLNYIVVEEALPKVFKDEMMQNSERAGTEINTLFNQRALYDLEQSISKQMSPDSGETFIVHQFTVKVIPKLSKMMKKLNVLKPLILVVKTSNNVVAYIAFPKGPSKCQESQAVSRFCELAGDCKVDQTDAIYRLVKGKSLQSFLDAAGTVQREFSAETNQGRVLEDTELL